MAVLSISCFWVFIWYVGRCASRLSYHSLTEQLLASFLLFTSSIIITGFCLSGLQLTANVWAWAGGVFVPATLVSFVLQKLSKETNTRVHVTFFSRLSMLKNWYAGLSIYLKCIFGLMTLTLTVIAVTNLLLVVLTPPNEWDSMTGHLNRVVQYIQRGSMAHFGGTNWNMDTYPKSVSTIQIYSFLMLGKVETAFKLIHHLSYWVTILAVFGIAQRIAKNLTASIFCGLAFGLFLDFLMQATTTETDIVLAAYLSCLLFFLFSYKSSQQIRHLYWAALAIGVVYGHKVTFTLLVPSVFVVALFCLFSQKPYRLRPFVHFVAATVICFCIWTLPTGYLRNIQVFGHPIGPPTALKHQSIERALSQGGVKNLIKQGTRNVIRYGYDFVNLDGLRNTQTGAKLNTQLRQPLVWIEDKLRLRLDDETNFTILPFTFERRFLSYNANPYWGILGFGLVFPLLLLVLLGIVRSRVHVVLMVALGLHWLALSYSAPYDPFKGRYFQETGIFGVLLFTLLFTQKINLRQPNRWLLKSYVGVVVVVACLSALMAVFLNVRALPVSVWGKPAAFDVPRTAFVTFGRADITPAYQKFEQLVPENATVALGTINDDFEYPLYGPRLSRRLITINPFEKGLQPIPKEADYLFFSKNVIKPLPTDIRLGTDTTMSMDNLMVRGEDYYLRKLK